MSRLGSCVPAWHHQVRLSLLSSDWLTLTDSQGRVLSVGHLLVRPDPRLRVTGYYGLVISGLTGEDGGLYR